MLQVRPLVPLRIVEWGISFNAAALATPIVVELVETGTIFATVVALVEADIQKVNDPGALAATMMTLSTTGTGYTASAEGTIVATRNLDATMFISGLSRTVYQTVSAGDGAGVPGGQQYAASRACSGCTELLLLYKDTILEGSRRATRQGHVFCAPDGLLAAGAQPPDPPGRAAPGEQRHTGGRGANPPLPHYHPVWQ